MDTNKNTATDQTIRLWSGYRIENGSVWGVAVVVDSEEHEESTKSSAGRS